MKNTSRLIWIAVAAIAALNLAVYISHAAKVTNVAAAPPQVKALKPPANGQINVAFLISEGADVMDIAGPWEAFGDTMFNTRGKVWHPEDGDMIMPFHLYTVSDSLKPVNADGLTVVPDYTFA